jgi:hypothetical protein
MFIINMKFFIKIGLILAILSVATVISCMRIKEFPPEPSISYLTFEKILNVTDSVYDRGVLKFEYTDGDGDIGLAKWDTLPPFNP